MPRFRSQVVVFFALVLTSCRTPPPSIQNGPHVVLITIDTLRADHLSCYGYPKPTSPFLDKLAAEGVRFENAYSASSWTAPSMASIFTALYPRQHGVLHGVAEQREVVRQEYLDPRFLTLAEMMKAAGYETFAVLSNGHTSRETGFARGFDHFQSLWFKECPEPNDVVAQWRSRLQKAPKFFLWVHYFDPHAPYTWREDWLSEHAARRDECEKWAGVQMRELRMSLSQIRSEPAARQALVDLYDGEIRYCDEHIRRLFDMLGLESNALIIVTADHGEEFLEHGNLGHGENLYEPSVRVPLIVRFPDRRYAGRVATAPVSNKDIMPTLADILSVAIERPVSGVSLAPHFEEDRAEPADVFLELDRGADWKAVRQGDWKYILRGRRGKELLFDLAHDPGEKDPLHFRERKVAARLRAVLENWMQQHPVFIARETAPNLDARQREQLRSLGYIR